MSLTGQGFKRDTYDDIVANMIARGKNLFGEDKNFNENSPLGIFIRVVAYFISLIWQLAEKVYYSGYVDTAEGLQLDNVGKYIGIKRRQAESATGQVTITGTPGVIIPAGFLVATAGGVAFATTANVAIGGGGTVTANISAVVGGTSGNVPANTIKVIVNPTAGISAVNNAAETTGGKDIESDEEFRDRYNLSTSKTGSPTTDSIRASLLATSGVRSAIVRENKSDATVAGIPPHSIAPIVYGGTDADVAQTLFTTKSAGIESYGTTTVVKTDLSGNTHNIGFTRPTVISIYAAIALTTNASFPADGNDQVRTKIIQYVGGTDADSTVYDGLTLGEDVIYAQCIAAAMQIPGITDIELLIGTDGITYNPANIPIADTEVALTDYNKVVIS